MVFTVQEKPPQPDIVHDDIAGAEKRLRELKGHFGKVSSRWDRGPRLRRFFRQLSLFTVVAICSFGFFWYFASSPWPVGLTLKHLAAFPNCAAAETMGLAPARKGQPGYWRHNDRDADGIACEWSKYRMRHMVVPAPLR